MTIYVPTNDLPAGVEALDSSRAGVALAAGSDLRPLAGAGIHCR